ncbi:MAG: hypothetical protein K0R31_25 [Clostridiales bacterium]|nr:hypothetical protein [Clostridiales bacterium]
MKMYRNTIILIVVLGLLLGTYFFLSKKKPADDSAAEDQNKVEKIIEIDSDKLQQISITNKDGKFVFEYKKKSDTEKEWILTSPAGFKADNSKIQDIATKLVSLNAEKVIDENAADLAQFGFKNNNVIEVQYEGGSKAVELGDKTQTKDAYYLREKSSNKVYTVSTSIGDSFTTDRNSLRDKTLYTLNFEKSKSLTLLKGDNIAFSVRKNDVNDWSITAPIEGIADYSKISPILDIISRNSSIVNFIEEKPSDLDKYGLKKPAYTIEFETDAGKTKLLIGDSKEKGKEIYAKLDSSSEVVTLNESAFTFLDKPMREIMQEAAYAVNIQNVSKVAVNMDGSTTSADITIDKEDESKDKFIVNGKDASALKDNKGELLFKSYYEALSGVTMDQLDFNAKPSGSAEITFTYTLNKAPGTMKVEFIPKDSNYYYVVRNDKYTGMLVAKSKFDGLREAGKKLLDALK